MTTGAVGSAVENGEEREKDRERGFMRVEERKRDSVEDRREKSRWRNESLRRSPFASDHGGRRGER